MSDRCMIGVANSNNTITTVYCHWNGDPKDAGTILAENYQSAEKVGPLMRGGFLGVIAPTLEESRRMDPPEPAVTIADRQEFQLLGERMNADFLYLFAEGEWLFATPYDEEWRNLTDVLASWR